MDVIARLSAPILVAPMAGGPSTVDLVVAAADAGGLGLLAAGYKSPDAVRAELEQVAESGRAFGLNIFVPSPPPPDLDALVRFRDELAVEAARYDVPLPELRLDDDDHYRAKVELALAAVPALVTFTFGVPGIEDVAALRAAGSVVLITVTNAHEARAAAFAEPDGLVAQGGSAGGHASTTDPASYDGSASAVEALREVVAAVDLPAVAAGGVATSDDVAELLAAGARAVQVGTMFLLADEAGTRAVQREAMLSGRYAETVVTRAFTGQPARGLRNRFIEEHSGTAPVGYPAIHHLTAPLRKAAAEAGDPDGINLWAGTGHAAAVPGTTREILERLSPRS